MIARMDRRKLFKAGNSTVLSVPPDFLKINNLERGDRVDVTWLGPSLRVAPAIGSGKGNEIEEEEGKLNERLER